MAGVEVSGRWRRTLLLPALMFGVVAMHSVAAPAGGHGCPTSITHEAGHRHVLDLPAAERVAPRGCDHGPGVHHLLHLCLAVMAVVFVLGLAIAVLLGCRRENPPRVPAVFVWARARPPPRMGVRLAQLGVLRN